MADRIVGQQPSAASTFQASSAVTLKVELPKGGGAIRGIGEKFASTLVKGTGSMSVPIATSPGRSGFGPHLSLSYDSGAGNGIFGFGWSLSLPSITRKTDRGLPQYLDADDSDVFILSESEDLIPKYRRDGAGAWLRDPNDHLIIEEDDVDGYRVRRYRPRLEGAFTRIERWTLLADPRDVHWRTLSKDNVLNVYGSDARSRIADPAHSGRIFRWLICETRDDRGNAVLYRYKAEDGEGVDLSRAHEANRGQADDPRRAVNRYPKRIHYGNRTPLLDAAGNRPRFLDADAVDAQIAAHHWMFEVVFDYGEHERDRPAPADDGKWFYRQDSFSTYRSGFEIRTSRLCQRVLMFHHFADEPGVGDDCLVRSTDFTFSHQQDPVSAGNPVYTFLLSVTQHGYRRTSGDYHRSAMPPVDYEYTKPVIQSAVHEVDLTSLEHLPSGVDDTSYRWIDLHGEGIAGVLTEQAGAWFYTRNISPISERHVELAALERVTSRPNIGLQGGDVQIMDLSGSGRADLVVTNGPAPGVWPHDANESWNDFRPFASRLNRALDDPTVRLLDLDGDGYADALITEHEAFVWHRSEAEGFGEARRVPQAPNEEQGARLVFGGGAESIYLADLSGDGLTDLVRVRNGEVCYWPNLGYGHFGAKVAMDGAPYFDHPDQFDHRRVRLADIDGSGTTDLIYLHRDGVRLYFNQSGNSWSGAHALQGFPLVDDISTVVATDLRGNGTACLVWSSPLAAEGRRPLRYVDLMGGQKPHLLIRIVNNLGVETHVTYASSTKFYLQDNRDGRPWLTRLPFPVHVVERVETVDVISRNRFVTRYRYHHGYFDAYEREFRGFGMVEQWDTESLGALADGGLATAGNGDPASQVAPVHTKTWFHTGVYVGGDHVSDFFAGLLDANDEGEYYREPGLTDAQARLRLLPDSVLPVGLTSEEEREACRALKGAMLRQEVYGRDGSARADHPYTVLEQNFAVRYLQPRDRNPNAVFHSHPQEAITYHYERRPEDPRISHSLTLEVDDYGFALKDVAIVYGRRHPDVSLSLQDQDRQGRTLITYTENRVTHAVVDGRDFYRAPAPCESRKFELTGYVPTGVGERFQVVDFVQEVNDRVTHIVDAELAYEQTPTNGRQRRVIHVVRTLYRRDDLGTVADSTGLLPLGTLEPCGLPGESYRLAFSPGMLAQVFRRDGQVLLPNPAEVLAGPGGDKGGYLASQTLKSDGRFPADDPDDHWWVPGGRVFLSPNGADTAAQELAYARSHFFVPHRIRDPFHSDAVSTETVATYDPYDLLIVDSRDALGNRTTVGERLPDGSLDSAQRGHDYRVLQPRRVMDPNGNRMDVTFDALGFVVGTAVMGKPTETAGDVLDDSFQQDLDPDTVAAHMIDPLANPQAILGRASTRLVYDLFAYSRTKAQAQPQPAVVYTLARENHDSDPLPAGGTKYRHQFAYFDGFGREIQTATPAGAGPLVASGPIVASRWVVSGWTIFNDKGNPVRVYEPFFSAAHTFQFGVTAGVSAIVFYDPLQRAIATLHPNHSYEKVAFNSWHQTMWDVNDTVLGDPRIDEDIAGIMTMYFASLSSISDVPWQTWHVQRQDGALGAEEQDAALKASAHANTPVTTHLDTLGRKFLTIEHNGVAPDATPLHFSTRVELDMAGNERVVHDARGVVILQCDYDMLGARIHEISVDAGPRWMLNDVSGRRLRAWDGRAHMVRTQYDSLRRPARTFVTSPDPANLDREVLTERLVYGEQHPEADARNLRGVLHLHFDQAGVAVNQAYDFKGNLVNASRRLARDYHQTLDWSALDAALPAVGTIPLDLTPIFVPHLEADEYSSQTTYDALNRAITMTTPHTPAMAASIIRPRYNDANLVDRIDANLRGAQQNGALLWTAFVTGIEYDPKGQRQRIDYGNGVATTYQYDPLTFRLMRLTTAGEAQFQALHYTYDPGGNITNLRDAAQQTVFFRNQQVEPSASYRYDPMYRLVEASGREHLGQVAGAPSMHSPNDAPRVGIDWSANDGNAMGTYVEEYAYDGVGNMLEMRHRGSNPAHPGWTRVFEYAEAGNRLTRTTVGTENPSTEQYVYDAHGNTTRLPHLGGTHPAPNLHWDYQDQLRRADLGGGGTAYYAYDATGQRVRKVCERSATLVEERLYFRGFEIFRRRQGPEVLERETLHIVDATRRVATVETRTLDTAGNDVAPDVVQRYQHDNHLGSATLELDAHAQVISYEEYTPYGSTVYQATRLVNLPKRYRFTAKERDEESGLYYYGARFYASWLGRWVSCDPIRQRNLFEFNRSNPLKFVDPDGMEEGNAVDRFLSRVKAGYKSNKVQIEAFAENFDVNIHRKQGAARFLEGVRQTESEHLIPRGVVDQLKTAAKTWYQNATTVVLPRVVSLNKTHRPGGDNQISRALKDGLITAEEAISRAKGNAIRSVADHWAQTGETTLKNVEDVAKLTEVAQKEASLSAKALKAAAPVVKWIKPIGVALTVVAVTEKTAHAASGPDQPPPDTATQMEQDFERAESAVSAVAHAATLLPGKFGAIAAGAVASVEIAETGIEHTGGDDRIREAGTWVEGVAKEAGWTDVNAETAGAVAAAGMSIGEGVRVLGEVASPVGWVSLGTRYLMNR